MPPVPPMVKPDQWWGTRVSSIRAPVRPPLPPAPVSRQPTPRGFLPPSPQLVEMANRLAASPNYTQSAQSSIGNVSLSETVSPGAGGTMWPPGYLGNPTPVVSVDNRWADDQNLMEHELAHLFDLQRNVTEIRGAGREPYGRIIDPRVLSQIPGLSWGEFKDNPYTAMQRVYGGAWHQPRYPTETYAYFAQLAPLIPPEMRRFYPQFTPQAYQDLPEALSEGDYWRSPHLQSRYRLVYFEDGSRGYVLIHEDSGKYR